MKKMGEFIEKIKEKAKDVKDTVVDTAKALPSIDILTQKFALELNAALAMENAGVKRLQARIEAISLPEARQQMQHYIQESQIHQKRLQQLVS
jgi:hypothetical protein